MTRLEKVGPAGAPAGPTRRAILAGTAAAGSGLAIGTAVGAVGERRFGGEREAVHGGRIVPFHGTHQAGVTSTPGAFATFLSLDLLPDTTAARLRSWMRLLTDDAARLTQGRAALADVEPELAATPAGLTVTFGFGRGFVERAGGEVPAWLGPLPPFAIDKLEERWCGGDVLILVQSDEPNTIAHTARMLLKDSLSFATPRWRQDGFRRARGSDPSGTTMRNLFGQVDGTANPRLGTPDFDAAVWARPDAPAWLQGGTGLVVRRIAMQLDTWDAVDRPAREASIGRRLDTGAPLTGKREHDPLDLEAVGPSGLPIISSVAHARRAHVTRPEERIVRLGYSYEDSGTVTESGLASAGLIFGSFQADVNAQFVPIQRSLAEADLLNVWTTPIGSAVFAIPPGCDEGGFIGEGLLG